ncbi:Uncharacterised protein [uncultured Dorea sp.]|nr:Uncharacterised protein [uncultured Dorea sp.]
MTNSEAVINMGIRARPKRSYFYVIKIRKGRT